jgi:BA14K-like protein
MIIDLDKAGRQPLMPTGAVALCRAAAACLLVAATWLIAPPTAGAAPVAKAPNVHGGSMVVQGLTTCDTRGCFTFGPQQSYHRPNYQPLDPTGPGFASPLGGQPPRFIFSPQAPMPLPQARLPAADPSFHRQSCMNRYRTYNSLTDSFIGSGGRSVRCVLPAGR